VTSGWRIQWPPIAMIAIVGAAVAALNATSGIMEAQTGGRPPVQPAEIWLWEVSSVFMVVALSPAVGWMVWRIPPPLGSGPPAWLRAIGIHLAAACIYSVAHVLGMVLIRTAGYATVGWTYDFSYQGDNVMPFLYEWRKDLLTYLSNAVLFWGWGLWRVYTAEQDRRAGATPMTADARIEIRDGARVTLIEPGQIAWIEAAGNYVEIHVGGATHLERGTLAAFEAKLAGRGFVRIHRSRLINRARIAGFRPTPSGDLEITLDDGRMIAGSRRFRAALET
jgi:hypothetical protein